MKIIVVLFFSFLSFTAYANHSCSGKVEKINVDKNGLVLATISGLGNDNVLCNLTGQTGTFNTQACNAVLSMLMTAKLSGMKVMLWFNIDTDTSCNKGNWISFADHGFYHFRMEDPS